MTPPHDGAVPTPRHELSPVGSAFDNAPMAMVLCSDRGVVQQANPAFDALLRRPAGALLGTPLFDVTHPDDVPAAHEACDQLSQRGGTSRFECRFVVDGGEAVGVLVASRLVEEPDGSRHIVMVIDDVTDRRAAEARLTELALHDPLTGLANRRLFDDRLAQALAGRRRAEGSVAVLYLDLDGFKQVNDVHGHAAGDAVLREVAARLQSVLRPADTAARVGGDEFAVLAVDVSEEQAAALLIRAVQAVEQPVPYGDEEFRPQASAGVVTASASEAADEVLHRADRAMYDAKTRTRTQ
ncbi:PAS domain S-box-containing protein/diguanylate cyclase (GGDEF)-like protein [Motilibacter peucedani]|uniref:PAS domain S-box-containing protein/diguanylate cyclase (GGDEF)-like protein n=1 Tax=Motilibacter peucedani TaxID=598650 RepID=A0A420XNF7_9ACTN|nr:GGDEF domain-containing protein [Motilibacter peucedani]RKS72789.1 PAS domain S-box-containing protein/diguanylate cyclase (GGDEF)-like protein [Motilibacter peucedani]